MMLAVSRGIRSFVLSFVFFITQYARLDLDILQIGILLETGADEAAMDLYKNGWNSVAGDGMRSLQQVALSDLRQEVDQFLLFATYFDSQQYDDQMILDGMQQQGMLAQANRDQRAEFVTRALQSMVLYMLVLEKLYTSIL